MTPNSPSFEKDAAKQLGLRSIAMGFILALTLQTAAFYTNSSQKDAASWVVHTVQAENQINRAFILIQNLERIERGFLLTHNENYLIPFNDALEDLNQQLVSLAELISDNPVQIKNVARLTTLAGEKVDELNQTISTAKNNNFDAAVSIVRTGRGEAIMDKIQTVTQIALDEENKLLDERVATYEHLILVYRVLSSSALIVALGLLILVSRRGYLLINRSIRDFIEYRDAHDNELVQARDKAEVAEKAKSLFLASMSHEIRTPMTGVVGLTEMLSKTSLNPEQLNLVENMRSTNQTLNTIINDVLDYSRIEAGKLSIEKVPFEFRRAIEDVVSTFHQNAVEKGLRFDATFGDSIPHYVLGDPTRLRQVLFNLVNNAIKFTDEGEVQISVTSPIGEYIEIIVTDTGKGISAEQAHYLFQAFEQADNTVSRTHGGTGLGLSICKNLVELMGGEINVSSNVGEGATFQVRIPLPEVAAPLDSINDARKPIVADFRPMKVLVAEDVEINQMILESILKDKGHTCTFANDGEEAINAVQEDDYDLILMDIRMPKVDGIEAYKRIRAIGTARCNLPIVAVTADVAGDQISTFLKLGFDGVASKPINPDKLFETIYVALEANNYSSE